MSLAKLILSEGDRVVGVQGYAGSGKTTMLNRARALLEKRGYEVRGLAPSASAARTLEGEAGIGAETLQRFLARYAGVAAGRMTAKGEKEMRASFAKTVLIVDEGSLASTVQARDLLRIADSLRIPRVVLVGDEKQLDAVDAGKPFAQLQAAGMKTAVMDQIMRQRDPALKEAVEASLAGDIVRAFEKLGDNVAEVSRGGCARFEREACGRRVSSGARPGGGARPRPCRRQARTGRACGSPAPRARYSQATGGRGSAGRPARPRRTQCPLRPRRRSRGASRCARARRPSSSSPRERAGAWRASRCRHR